MKSNQGQAKAEIYSEDLVQSREFREDYEKRKGVVKAEEMPWEDSPHGKLKHIIHEKMNTRECALDMYQLFLDGAGRSGKHRHMSEEVFYVLEGKGYDLHWDVDFELDDKYHWKWSEEPKKFEWEEGDFVYIPPYTTHQHFNSDPQNPARLLSATSRLIKALGFDWLEQVEEAPGR
ncbi:MAG: cupin domain-containing protein [Deferrisomatales bacterium]|nr:cupin domain-containing protein [Deferrisomatales bacterium]